MEHILKELLKNISPSSVKKLVEEHVDKIKVDNENKKITLKVNKKFVFNTLNSAEYIWDLIKWIKKTYGEDYKTVIKLSNHIMKGEDTEHHDREMNTPYKVHYK